MPEQPDNIVPITSDARTAAEKFSAEHDRELLTILFTDLVDSTKLQQEAGNVEAARLTELHRDIVREELAKYDAREIEWAGDSCLAVFTKPSDAVVFALRMQAEHRRIRESEPKLLNVRVGMHLGEIVVKKRSDGGKKSEDLFGLQVSEAARVMSVARGNQVFCTRAVFDNARGALKGRAIEGVGDAVWVNYGAYLLKGSEEPVELCEIGSADVAVLKAPEANDKVAPVMPGGVEAMRALIPYEEAAGSVTPGVSRGVLAVLALLIAVGGILVGRYLIDFGDPGRATDSDSKIRSLAVLPFENLMGDETKEYFVDGMTDTLTAELSKIGSIKVIARTSAMHYKNTDKRLSEIARELGVDGLIEGSVQQFGDEIRITAQLVHGRSEEHLWADNFEGTLTGVMKLQGEVAVSIADQIGAVLTPEERDKYASAKDVNPEAYDLYLQGRSVMQSRLEKDLLRAIELFESATMIEPEYALAYSGMADAFTLMNLYAYASVAETEEKAFRYARRAVELDDTLSDAFTSLGGAYLFFQADLHWAEAERAFLRAIALNPDSVRAHGRYSDTLWLLGRLDDALGEAQLAVELDPLNALTTVPLGSALHCAERFDEAETVYLRSAELDPSLNTPLRNLAWMYSNIGHYEDAVEYAERAYAITKTGASQEIVLNMRAVVGGPAAIQNRITEIELEQGEHRENLAVLYAALGDFDKVFLLLEKQFLARTQLNALSLRTWGARYTLEARRDFLEDPRFWALFDRFEFPPLPPEHPRYAYEQAYLRQKAAEAALAAQPKPVRRFTISLAPGETLKQSQLRDYSVAVSPDGSHVAYVAIRDGVSRLMLRPIDQLAPIELPGTEAASHPTFSPDGQSLCFFADGFLKRTDIQRGVPESVHAVSRPLGASWMDDQRIIFSSNVRAPLQTVHLDTRETERVLEIGPEEGVHAMPHILPGGKGLLFVAATAPTIATSNVELYVFETKERRVLLRAATRPHYVGSGHIVAAQEGRFTALPFDLESLEVTGGPVQLAGDIASDTPRDFGISEDGMLVHASRSESQSQNRHLVWVDETGQEERVDAPSLPYFRVRISPDGTRAAIDMNDLKTVYLLNLTRGGTPRALTFANESAFFPIWTPDSRDLIFPNRFDPDFSLARKTADGSVATAGFVRHDGLIIPNVYSPGDNTLLASSKDTGPTGLSIISIAIEEPYEIRTLVEDAGNQYEAALSPDGKWLAYVSNESGIAEIMVRPYPSLAGKWQVSTGFAFGPKWDRDGKRLFYRSADRMMAVDIETDPSFISGEPLELFDQPYHFNTNNSTYDRSPIDDRFLMIKRGQQSDVATELVVVENWFEEVKRSDPGSNAN